MSAWPAPGMRSGLTLMPTGAYQGANRADPDRRGAPPAAALKHEHHHCRVRHRYRQSRGMDRATLGPFRQILIRN